MQIKEINDYILIEHNASINEVIEKMNDSIHKILFVVDRNKLVGTITDGDIRRCIYDKKNNISELKASEIMNTNPKYILISLTPCYWRINKEILLFYKNGFGIKTIIFIRKDSTKFTRCHIIQRTMWS